MRNRFIFLGDVLLIALWALVGFALRVDWEFPHFANAFKLYLLTAILAKPPVLMAFGAYGRFWRYASIREYVGLGLAVTATIVPMVTLIFFALIAYEAQPFPRSIFAIDWL